MQPYDEHNRRLESHVHPPDWENPAPQGRYHLVVIGGGPAGLVTAVGAAGLGAKVALVERSLLGGDCLNVGCVPSKGLISAARAAAAVRDAGRFGLHVPASRHVDFAAAMERVRRLRADLAHHDAAARFRDLGIDVFLGQGRFVDDGVVDVEGARLSYRKAVVATGARAAVPPIPGLDGIDYLTNESVFSLTELPGRLMVLGGGPIGAELAQALARFGSQVVQIEMAPQILPREDVDAAGVVQRAMERDGVRFALGARALQIVRRQGEIAVIVRQNGTDREIVGDQLLIGIGRSPNVTELGLERIGVEYDERAGIRVDQRLRTTNPRVYAAGDVCSEFKFTHAADFMARIVIQNALFAGRRKASALTIPWCTYTSPELAHVGISGADAARRGIAIDTLTQQLSEIDRAILDGEDEGFVRVHLRKGTDRILGATIVATHAGELISEFTLAITHRLGLKKIAATIHPYPTQAEAIRKLGDQFNRSRLTPFIKKLLERWLRWVG